MVKLLADDYNLKIITRDRDQLQDKPYENIKTNQWNDSENCKIYYKTTNPSSFTDYRALITIINNIQFDIYYLNSLFAFSFSVKIMLLRAFGLIPNKHVLIAPRGEVNKGALGIKSFKKRVFLLFVKLIGLYKNVTWHASTKEEAESIQRVFGNNIKVKIALDVPNLEKKTVSKYYKKEKGKLKILFISSIAKNKNLKFVIETLNKVNGDFTLDIYGPIKDTKYWSDCKSLIDKKIADKINYRDIVPYELIHTIYPNYNLFFFPTFGESFGHVIFESLLYNCPVLCSDKTPFNDLNYFNAGWNIPIENKEKYLDIIESLFPLDNNEYNKYSIGCGNFIEHFKNDSDILKNNYELFNKI